MRSCSSSPVSIASSPSTTHTSPVTRERIDSSLLPLAAAATIGSSKQGLTTASRTERSHMILSGELKTADNITNCLSHPAEMVPMTVTTAIESSSQGSYSSSSSDGGPTATSNSKSSLNPPQANSVLPVGQDEASNSSQLVVSPATITPASVSASDSNDQVVSSNSDSNVTGSNNSNMSRSSSEGADESGKLQNGDKMLFTKKAISKTNSMTSAFSSFSSVNAAHHNHHNNPHQQSKHKHRHRHEANGQMDDPEVVVDESILGTSCDCSSPPAMPQPQISNKSRIQTPASRPLLAPMIEEKIGMHQPFEEPTKSNDGTSGSTTAANSPEYHPTALPAISTSALEQTSTEGVYLRNKNNKYVPAVAVMPSEQLTRQQFIEEPKTENPPDFILMSRLKNPQTSLKFPYIGLKTERENSNSLPSSFKNSAFIKTAPTTPPSGPAVSATALTSKNGAPAPAISRAISVDSVAQRLALQRVHSSNEVSPPPKQIREPKTPLYLPAVLRRTAPSSPASYASSPFSSPRKGSTSSEHAPPTRHHWKPDQDRDTCRECDKQFTFFDRRHHCRKCGDIFCAKDARWTVYLDHFLIFDPLGCPSRACHSCWTGYQSYKQQLALMQQSVKEVATPISETVALTAPTAVNGSINSVAIIPVVPGGGPPISQSVIKNSGNLDGVGSVPADWNWSTF